MGVILGCRVGQSTERVQVIKTEFSRTKSYYKKSKKCFTILATATIMYLKVEAIRQQPKTGYKI